MVVGTLKIGLRLDGCFNLKDKRRIVRSLLDHAHRDFQVAAAETADTELWNQATIGIAYVSNQATHVEKVLSKVETLFTSRPDAEMESIERTITRMD
jgi:uncharacterized protein YlxP (DUF503 family)